MNNEDTQLLETHPHLTRADLDLFDSDTKARLLAQSEKAKAAPKPKLEKPKTAPPVTSLLLGHRVGGDGSIISKSRGVLVPGEPITLDDLGPGGIDAWNSLVKRGKIALHPDLKNPGDGGDDAD